jgi:hypothetical protein
VYVGSNAYITFGSGSSNYSGLSASNPAIDKIMMNSGDRSWQRVATYSTSSYVRIRYEGSASTSGTVGASTVIYECTIFNPSVQSGNSVIEWIIGSSNIISSTNIAGIYSSSALITAWSPAANTSYVFASNSTGTAWQVYSAYISGYY